MADNLVIVESPTKARTIGKMLGSNYKILASMGHVRDLPEHSFGVDLKNHFEPKYVENSRSKKVVKELRSAAKKAKAIFLAPDPDREGEAIAWHLQELLAPQFEGDFQRVTFHEITKSAISRAFEHATSLNMNLVDAQQARRVLDRLVGYKVSPLLWSHIVRGTSAGRVQTVALRLVVEREREILDFKPEEYWTFSLILEADGKKFEVKLFKINGNKFKIDNEQDAAALLEAVLNGDGFTVDSIETSDRRRNAPPPFTTSTLQQAANNMLRMSASNTMRVAQQLYEGIDTGAGQFGLITYMRTDSVNIAREAQAACRDFIGNNFGQDYVPPKPNFYKSKSGAQEAHEAIRPTDVTITPESIRGKLDDHQYKLYNLIWKRFVASQMSKALQRQTAVNIINHGADGKSYIFRANAMVTVFPGFLKMFGEPTSQEAVQHAQVLGSLREEQPCGLVDSKKEQKFTEPPPRYSEAALIKALEENGIGRPSTYATILRTIQTRNYVEREKGKLHPTELGFKVCDFLISILPNLFEVDFTSKMETLLDNVEEGKLGWTQMLEKFYDSFSNWVEEAKAIGAPDAEKAGILLGQLEKIQNWAPAEKRGRRTYDDSKFYKSIRDKYAEEPKLTARQWGVLLRLGAKYIAELPELKALSEKHDFAGELEEAVAKQKELEEKLANGPSETDIKRMKHVLSFFEKVQWAEPVKRGRRTYDDKKFFTSFTKQVDQGRLLSEKQLGVLQRFAVKYREGIEQYEALCRLIGIDPNQTEEEVDAGGKPAEQDPEVQKMLDTMAKVTAWAEPVKKGKRVFDDKAFFESLAKQASAGRKLSPRQAGALKKLVVKYS
ncbi:type I DNA topoisomerase [Lentisphaerota bacterium ZTH]|nr:type I DNA topoisomerase [Lentisphaerota bacterium]WET05464.1 type I DNA topoisomerase [Lentisphaerota bacterium ZTH]